MRPLATAVWRGKRQNNRTIFKTKQNKPKINKTTNSTNNSLRRECRISENSQVKIDRIIVSGVASNSANGHPTETSVCDTELSAGSYELVGSSPVLANNIPLNCLPVQTREENSHHGTCDSLYETIVSSAIESINSRYSKPVFSRLVSQSTSFIVPAYSTLSAVNSNGNHTVPAISQAAECSYSNGAHKYSDNNYIHSDNTLIKIGTARINRNNNISIDIHSCKFHAKSDSAVSVNNNNSIISGVFVTNSKNSVLGAGMPNRGVCVCIAAPANTCGTCDWCGLRTIASDDNNSNAINKPPLCSVCSETTCVCADSKCLQCNLSVSECKCETTYIDDSLTNKSDETNENRDKSESKPCECASDCECDKMGDKNSACICDSIGKITNGVCENCSGKASTPLPLAQNSNKCKCGAVLTSNGGVCSQCDQSVATNRHPTTGITNMFQCLSGFSNASLEFGSPQQSDQVSPREAFLMEQIAGLRSEVAKLTRLLSDALARNRPAEPMDTQSETQKRGRSPISDLEQPSKKATSFSRINAGQIVDNKFIFCGKSKGLSKGQPAQSSVSALPSQQLHNNAQLTPSVSITTVDPISGATIADESEGDDDSADGSEEDFTPAQSRYQRKKARKAARTASSTEATNTSSPINQARASRSTARSIPKNPKKQNQAQTATAHQNTTIAAASTSNNVATTPMAESKKPFRKPPPITVTGQIVEGISVPLSVSEITETIVESRGKFHLQVLPKSVRIFPQDHSVHPLICKSLNDKNYEFYSHDLQEHKIFRSVLRNVDVMDINEISSLITEAVGVSPLKVTMTANRRAPLYMVDFKATDVNKATLTNVHTVGHYRVRWEPPKKMRNGPTQCTNCCDYGHGQRNCAKGTVCLLCASSHHFTDCEMRLKKRELVADLYQCTNCMSNQFENRAHAANDLTCPSRAKFIAAREAAHAAQRKKPAGASPATQTTPKKTTKPIKSAMRTRSLSRTRTAPSASFADVLNSNSQKPIQNAASSRAAKEGLLSWKEIATVLSKAYTQIMNASSQQEQMAIAFGMFAASS